MKWVEKIRAMDARELAELLLHASDHASDYEGIMQAACDACPFNRNSVLECDGDDATCLRAMTNYLESEVGDDEQSEAAEG